MMSFSLETVIVCALAFTGLEIALFIYRKTKSHYNRNLLNRAKQEANDIAQLPLNNPHPLVQINKDGSVIFANPAALQLFPGIQDGARHQVIENISGAETREISYQNKIFQQTISETRINNAPAYIVYFYDITTLKIYQKKLEKAYQDTEAARQTAIKAKEARGEFLANMSHELRTPMNGIIGLSDILKTMQSPPDEKEELISTIHSAAQGLLILLNDILDFSKIEAGELSIETIPFHLNDTLQSVTTLHKPIADQKNLDLRYQINENVPQSFVGDPNRLQQILNNLLGNAIKFTDTGTVRLIVEGTQTKDSYTLQMRVIDTGIGIAKNKQTTIFEQFQQADASTARKYGGTGLGLAITKNLITLMNGSLDVESEEGDGTTFTVSLPLEIADQATAQLSANIQNGGGGLNWDARILIVDDHPVNVMFMEKTLQRMGFKTINVATGGQESITMASAQHYDVILMDCHMPDMDGFEATREIKALNNAGQQPVIIAVTANAMRGAHDQCTSAGMDDYISKPFNKEKLHSVLEHWIPGGKNSHGILYNSASFGTIPQQNINEHNSVLNWSHINDFSGGDKTIQTEIIAIFLKNLNKDIDELKGYFQAQNLKDWDACIHKIYGGCSHVGALDMANLCDHGQSLYPDLLHEIPTCHHGVVAEHAKVLNALSAYMGAEK